MEGAVGVIFNVILWIVALIVVISLLVVIIFAFYATYIGILAKKAAKGRKVADIFEFTKIGH